MRPLHSWLIAVLVAAVACAQADSGAGSGPAVDTVQVDDSLNFLRPAPGAPPFGTRVVSFYAVRGQQREARLMYAKAPGATDSAEFLRFRVDDRSLVNRPDGTPIALGDSLLITLSIDDSTRLISKFEPGGLQFNPTRPARLTIKYGEADPDLDGNGVVNAQDTLLIRSFRIWRQETPGEPWLSLPSTVSESTLEVEADISGFTRYAVAY